MSDFKRLCEAVEEAYRDWYGDHGAMGSGCAEATARAVLMALREPSQEMQRAADAVEMDHGGYRAPIGPEAGEAFTAMIDAILAEPAKA